MGRYRGQVGVESLVLFIALIIVSVLGASILVHSAGFLQSQALGTSEESADQVLNGVDVYSTQHREHRFITSRFLAQDGYDLVNDSITLESGGNTLSYARKYYAPDINVSSGDSVTFVSGGESVTTPNGTNVFFFGSSTLETNGTLLNLTNHEFTLKDDGDGTVEQLSLEIGDQSITVTEGETVNVTERETRLFALETREIETSVSSGGAVTLESRFGTIRVHDGGTVTATSASPDAAVALDNGTTKLRGKSFSVVSDGDGKTETVQFTLDGTTLTYTENGLHELEISHNDSSAVPRTPSYRNVSWNIAYDLPASPPLTAVTSATGNVTLTDGEQTLTVYDEDPIDIVRVSGDALRIRNENTSESFATDNETLTLVDDGDGTAERLTLETDIQYQRNILLYEKTPSRVSVEWTTALVDAENATFSMYIGPSPGAGDVDLRDATIQVIGPTGSRTLTYQANRSRPGETFTVKPVKDEDETAPVLSSRTDRFQLRFSLRTPQKGDLTVILTTPSGSTRKIIIPDD